MSPASLAPLPNKNHVPETLAQLQVTILGGRDYKLLHCLHRSCLLLCVVGVWLFRLGTEEKWDLIFVFFFFHVQMDTNAQISVSCDVKRHTVMLAKRNASLVCFFCFVLIVDIQLPSPSPNLFLFPVYVLPKCFDLLTTDQRSESRHSGCWH